jgi:sulfonate transport system substrate-binding protein
LTGGTTDAITTADPMLSQMLRNGQARILIAGGAPLTTDLSYLVAANGALEDPQVSAEIGDFAVRLARATRWQREHLPDAIKTYAQIRPVPTLMN